MYPRRKPTLVLLMTLLVFSFLAIQPSPVTAAAELTFLVNSTEDLPDFAPGNGLCDAYEVAAGPCTLRAAIYEANLNIHYTNVTILVTPGVYTLTIPPEEGGYSPSNGDLDIQSNSSTNLITIKSTGAPGDVVITTADDFHDRILTIGMANVSISDIVFSESNLEIAPFQGGGGAIHNFGTLKLDRVKFTDNTVSCEPGLNCQGTEFGGAIVNQGELTVVNSSFMRNSANKGSAIFNGGHIDIGHSTFTQNTTSTIESYSDISILNSTFSGGDIGIANNGQLFLRSNTFANFAETIRNDTDKHVYAANNIFTTQSSKNFTGSGGDWVSGGYNIFSDNSWPGTYETGDLPNTNPRLGLLGSYGGPTLTHPLLEGSPAIDHRPGYCSSGSGKLGRDQRHFPRNDGKCDTGSFEHSGNFFKMLFLPLIRR